MLKIQSEELEDRQVMLTVEVPDDRFQAAMRSTARRLSRSTKIPGFRPGKAPYNVVVGKLGEEAIFEEVLESLGQEVYQAALEESELEPFAPGSLDEVMSKEPLILRYTVPLTPEVELGSYKDIRLPYDDPDVSDEDLEAVLEDLRQRRALIEPTDRPAELSDVVIVDIRGVWVEPLEGEEPLFLDQKGLSLLVDEATSFPIPDISDHLVGMTAGDEKEIDYTFPAEEEEDEAQERSARFTIHCNEVKSRLVPEWSDDLAKNIGEFESLLDLRIKVRENLTEQATRKANAEYAQQVIEKILEGASITYPPVMVEEEVASLARELQLTLAGQNLSLEDWLKIEKKTIEELQDELEPRARERLMRGLALGKIVELENLEVEEGEIDEEINRMAEPLEEEGTDKLREVLEDPSSRRRLEIDLLTDRAIQHVVALAKGESLQTQEESADEIKKLKE